jgi:hypothetical protein
LEDVKERSQLYKKRPTAEARKNKGYIQILAVSGEFLMPY